MLNIFKASAGSGKTFNLAEKYIVDAFGKKAPALRNSQLFEAFKDTMAFARILAVTFTNKAAGEMKSRILKELDKLVANSSDPKEKSPYIDTIIAHYPEYTPETVAKRARAIRSAILHNYSDFNLKTIDAFVQRIVRAFCFDIDQNSGFTTQTDEDMVLDDLIDRLFKKSDDDLDLRRQLMDMAQKNVEDGTAWDFRGQVRSLAKLIFSEKFQDLSKHQKENIKEGGLKEYFKVYLDIINTCYNDYISKSKDLSKKITDAFDSLGVSINELGNVKYIYSWAKNQFLDAELTSTPLKYVDAESWLPKAVKPIHRDNIPALQSKVQNYLQMAVALVRKDGMDFLTAKAIRKDFYAFTLLGDLAQLLPEYRAENRTMLVSDATSFLNDIVENNDAPFIYERVGNKFDHIFIDEFQDTSAYQWNNFRPLIENTNAEGFENMIVGDVKQSIYRFRGGDWELLNGVVQQQIGDEMVHIETLDTNYRSMRNIVEFNDAIFQKAVQTLQNHCDTPEVYESLLKIYSDSYQKLPKADRTGGKVDVVFLDSQKDADDEEDTDFMSSALKRMASEIDCLIKSGVKAKKICILVRKNPEAAKCIEFLMDYQNTTDGAAHYDIVSAQSLFVASSLVVSIVVNTMKFVNDPSNMIAKVEAMRSFCQVYNKDVDDETLLRASTDDALASTFMPKGFTDMGLSCSDLPLYDLCERIVAMFDLQQFVGDSEYLRSFEDCVLDFTKLYSSDLNKFVKWWDESGVKTAIQPSENQNAVTVMTIHKSKGLDFSVQFIPFCTWKMEDFNNLKAYYIWVQAKDGPFAKLGVLPIRYGSSLKDTSFAEDYNNEKLKMNVDSLNLLYVALTRAVHELHIYCKKPKEGKTEIKTVSDLMYFAITENFPNQNPDIIDLPSLYNDDDSELLINKGHNMDTGRKEPEAKSFKLNPYKNTPWADKLNVTSHSSDFFIQHSPFIQDRINHGLFMHNIMSQIEFKEDIPDVLQDMVFRGRITEEQRKELSDMLDTSFKNPEVDRWFSHIWDEVFTERALLTTEGNIRIPDRVVTKKDETIVIDFKFGGEHDEYKSQIREYAQLLSKMKYPNIKAYLFYVEDSKIVEVE